ncbi:hypothetical protein BKA69DRAFT_1169697 [Paraphysoderma sedebokerense]|nr:hypothetical protein BKA69DRAFT_1169697 [Paraphysoderma sedebokerense]
MLNAISHPHPLQSHSTGKGNSLLYSLSFPVLIRSSANDASDINTEILHLNVYLSNQVASTPKILQFQLTSPTSPGFLYHLCLSDSEYTVLKEQQNLLVDFNKFPEILSELIKNCGTGDASNSQFSDSHTRHGNVQSGGNTNDGRGNGNPRYVAQLSFPSSPIPSPSLAHLSSTNATLSIVETNTFRQITHLSLNFVKANDEQVKNYLVEVVEGLKAANQTLRSDFSSLQSRYSSLSTSTTAQIHSLQSNLERLKFTQAEELTKIKIECTEDIHKEREKSLKEMENERREFEKAKRDLENHYEEKLRNLTQTNSSLTTSSSNYRSHLSQLESQLSSIKSQNSQLSASLSELQRDNENLEVRHNELTRIKDNLERELDNERERCRRLDKEKRELEAERERLELGWRESKTEKAELEASLSAYKIQITELELTIQKLNAEIEKSTSIISTLQTNLTSTKQKLKLKSLAIQQQESVLSDKSSNLETVSADLGKLKEEIDRLKKEKEEKEIELTKVKESLEEYKKKVEEGNDVIEWLHKQLNRDTVSKPLPMPSHSTHITHSLPLSHSYPNATHLQTYHTSALSQSHGPVGGIGIGGLIGGRKNNVGLDKPVGKENAEKGIDADALRKFPRHPLSTTSSPPRYHPSQSQSHSQNNFTTQTTAYSSSFSSRIPTTKPRDRYEFKFSHPPLPDDAKDSSDTINKTLQQSPTKTGKVGTGVGTVSGLGMGSKLKSNYF